MHNKKYVLIYNTCTYVEMGVSKTKVSWNKILSYVIHFGIFYSIQLCMILFYFKHYFTKEKSEVTS